MPVGGGRYPPPPTRVEIFYDPEKSMVAFETSSSLTVNGLSLADDGTAVECCVAYFNDTLLLHTECKPALLTIVGMSQSLLKRCTTGDCRIFAPPSKNPKRVKCSLFGLQVA